MQRTERRMLAVLTAAVMLILFLAWQPLAAYAANDTYGNATSLTLNKSVSDSLANSSDVNWYKFQITQAGYISIDFARSSLGDSSTYWKMSLYTSESPGVAASVYDQDYDGNSTKDSSLHLGLSKGTYYILIRRSVFSGASYTLTVNFTASANWEAEPNGLYTQANPARLNTGIVGSCRKSDTDFFSFKLPRSGYVAVDFVRPYLGDSSNYWRLCLYKPSDPTNAAYTMYIDGYSTKDSTPVSSAILPAGTYYVAISKWENHSGVDYTVTPRFGVTATALNNGYLFGDVNLDSKVDALDAAQILTASALNGAGLNPGLTTEQKSYADINGDGSYDATDAAKILEYSAYQGSGGGARMENYLNGDR